MITQFHRKQCIMNSMSILHTFAPLPSNFLNEPTIEAQAAKLLGSAKYGFDVHFRTCGYKEIDKHWPSKNTILPSGEIKKGGAPDLLLTIKGQTLPACVWENKNRSVAASEALKDAQFYIKHLHLSPAGGHPALPRLAAGFNGQELLLSYYTADGVWTPVKVGGSPVKDRFIPASALANGISSKGVLNSALGTATVKDLRALLPRLKTIYRNIPPLTTEQGRTPIDFTIAMLTLRLLVEQNPSWGTWAEQPSLQFGKNKEQRIAQRLKTLVDQINHDPDLADRYGKILRFTDEENGKASFDFSGVIDSIPRDQKHFELIFEAFDGLPPLKNADFDLFGEVYQSIGDKATKKALGEFFTGRHIISGVLPIFFARSGFSSSFSSLRTKKIADIACGTGGFLTETLRLARRLFNPSPTALKSFATSAFYGFDLGPTNASRARVNMYFAGDGFSAIVGGVDTLSETFAKRVPAHGFDSILTNPPYGQSSYGRTEEAFIKETLVCLRAGSGWGLLVLPTGVLENPRSADVRHHLLKNAVVTDVIELPKHAFAPYTLQKTSVVIFRKRTNPLPIADGDWKALEILAGLEEMSLYIVDNDGYANSDKRYPTDRKDASGRWSHNELTDWVDSSGLTHPSALFDSLINRLEPTPNNDQFGCGSVNAPKYKVLRVNDLLRDTAGVVLLPDAILRRGIEQISLPDFVARTKKIKELANEPLSALPIHLLPEIEALLSSQIIYPVSVSTVATRVDKIFVVQKGDQGLTEEFIYRAFDPSGIRVYGGGASEPRFTIAKDAATKSGEQITVFNGPKIVISMDGSSGAMRVVEDQEFCLNHHGAVLSPFDSDFDLHWFAQQAETGLKSLASNQEGSATLTKPRLESFEVSVPQDAKIRIHIGAAHRMLVDLREMLT
jgi:hypothetical protein